MTFLPLTPVPLGPGLRPLCQLPLLVLVGVTGVGKSTALNALEALLPGAGLLPDRRRLTDQVMIVPFAGCSVQDRETRFALTARWRETHPGGMAQALCALALEEDAPSPALFDGLRGLDEVRYAAHEAPHWRFVALDAPDLVRLRRLLGRADAFDRVAVRSSGDLQRDLETLDGAHEVFSAADLHHIAALCEQGYAAHEVLSKARIVIAERRHYDPQATQAFLSTLDSHRVLELDTVKLSPAEVAARIREWL